MGTSKSAEGDGLSELFGCALAEGMHISTHVQDLDSSSLLALRNTSIHCSAAFQSCLKKVKSLPKPVAIGRISVILRNERKWKQSARVTSYVLNCVIHWCFVSVCGYARPQYSI